MRTPWQPLCFFVFATSVLGCSVDRGAGPQPTCVDQPSVETLATLSADPVGLVLAGANAYVTEGGDGYLHAVPRQGGSSVSLGVKGRPMAATATDVIVLTGSGTGAVFGLVRVPLNGGAPTALVQNSDDISSVAVDEANVYYGVNGGTSSSGGGIYRVPLTGGAPVMLAAGVTLVPDFLAVDDTDVYWGSVQPGDTPVAGTLIGKVAKTGGSPVAFASGAPGAFLRALAVDQDAVYWIQSGPVGVMREPKAGGAPVVLATPSYTRAPLVLDDSRVYWVDDDGYTIMTTPKDGGAASALAYETSSSGSPPFIMDVAADSSGVYWTTSVACGNTTCQGQPQMRYLAEACSPN